ncbi:hypothetical protein E2562_000921 [Oryza meyeriana var. granulata]|uniref:FBD domain-containing protein n=1 Tax=Oryza meyeriana var. granulata TaxID=110450 RepID=A0A6G1CYY6_9ORYZ|nr:hypothetical protein E2562_000921 [Oryza meyeriana var. granulata]
MALPLKRKREDSSIKTARARKRARGRNAQQRQQYDDTCQDRISEQPDHLVLSNEKREQPGGVIWEPSDVKHCNLRQVEMYHFRMVQSEIALARLLLARSPSLQTITFCRGNLLRRPDWTVDYLEADKDWTTEQKAAITWRLATSNLVP